MRVILGLEVNLIRLVHVPSLASATFDRRAQTSPIIDATASSVVYVAAFTSILLFVLDCMLFSHSENLAKLYQG